MGSRNDSVYLQHWVDDGVKAITVDWATLLRLLMLHHNISFFIC